MNKTILIATKNLDKLKEFLYILKDSGYSFVTLKDFDDNFDVIENSNTYMGNAMIKAKYYYFKYKLPTISDDSGLEVKYLNNEPGLFSHRYSDGGYLENNKKVLKKLGDTKKRSARFITSICLYDDNGPKFFTKKLKGDISYEIKGLQNFGYDPIFIPKGETKTIDELGISYKNTHSARAMASFKLLKYLKKNTLRALPDIISTNCLRDITKLNNVKLIKRLEYGMSNYTYIFSVENKKVVFRLPGENSHVFINREYEKYNIEQVEKLGINTDLIYLNVDTGIKISKYIDGNVLDSNSLFSFIPKVVDILNLLESKKLKALNDILLVERLIKYSKLGDSNNKLFNEIFEFFKKVYKQYENDEKYLIHGDMQPSNLIFSDEKIKLVDWEYSGNLDIYYDIACFGNVNFSDSINLLTLYLKRKPTDEELRKLKIYRLQQTLQWFQVATYKHKIGLSKKLNIDFDKVAKKYIDLSNDLYNELKK